MENTSQLYFSGLVVNLAEEFVSLPSNEGITNGTCQVVFQFFPADSQVVIQGFSPNAMRQKGLQYIAEESLESSIGPCRAVRFQQEHQSEVWCKWAMFIPTANGTHFCLATFRPDTSLADQFVTISTLLRGIELAPHVDTMPQRLCEFDVVAPFKVAYQNGPQTILTEGGVFPVPRPNDVIINVSEVFIVPAKSQFRTFILERLRSLQAMESSDDIQMATPGVFDVTCTIQDRTIQDRTIQQMAARYVFLRAGVFLIEAIGGKEELANQRATWEAIFCSIRVKK